MVRKYEIKANDKGQNSVKYRPKCKIYPCISCVNFHLQRCTSIKPSLETNNKQVYMGYTGSHYLLFCQTKEIDIKSARVKGIHLICTFIISIIN
jgi:hypothetical protein